MKKKTGLDNCWLKLCNGLLSGVLALLGYTSCDSIGDSPVEYGSPHADYEIKGKVTDKETRSAVEGAHVVVKPMQWNSDETYPSQLYDTLYTDKDGAYLYRSSGMIDRFRVVCEDPSGVHKADSTLLNMNPEGGEGWYKGSDSQEANFELEKQQP